MNGIEVHRFNLKAPIAPIGGSLFLNCQFGQYINNFFVRNNYDVIIPENLDTLIPTWAVVKLKRGKIVYNIADFILMHTFQLEYDNKKNSFGHREIFH